MPSTDDLFQTEAGVISPHVDESWNDAEKEHFIERAAIYEYLGEKERDESELLAAKDTEAYRFKCEVNSVVQKYRERGGDAVKAYLQLVEKARGAEPAGRLREAALAQIKAENDEKRPK